MANKTIFSRRVFRFKLLYSPTPSQSEMLPHVEFQAKHLTRAATDETIGEALEIFANYPRYPAILGNTLMEILITVL